MTGKWGHQHEQSSHSNLNVTATDDAIGEVLRHDGCVIIKNAVEHAAVDALLADLADHIESKPKGTGNFTGLETKRVHSLFAKTEIVQDFVAHDKVLQMADLALLPYCQSYTLQSNSITAIGPGETVQPLHRDDMLYPLAHDCERNSVCTAFWALSDFTQSNGATRMVPGSHRWDDVRRPTEADTVQAVMTKGSVCLFLGGVYHGGGCNTTAEEWRIGMFSAYTLGWLRQEQNFYMAVPPEMAKDLPEKVARLLGYSLHRPFLGWIQDIQDPWDVLQGYEELSKGGDDIFADGEDNLKQGADIKVGRTQDEPAAGPSSPTASAIQTVDTNVGEHEMADILEEDGCVIVRNLIDHGKIDALLEDLEPYLSANPRGRATSWATRPNVYTHCWPNPATSMILSPTTLSLGSWTRPWAPSVTPTSCPPTRLPLSARARRRSHYTAAIRCTRSPTPAAGTSAAPRSGP